MIGVMARQGSLRSKHRLLLATLLAALVFVLADGWVNASQQAYALTAPTTPTPEGTPSNFNPETVDANGQRISCSSLPEAQDGVFLGKIVPCILRTIETSAISFSEQFIARMQPLFFAFLTFVIVMFGLKVLQNEGQIQAEAFKLLLKIGFAMTILAAIPTQLIPAAYGIMNEGQSIVMSTLGSDSSVQCDVAANQGEGTPLIWQQADCILGKLYGFTTGTGPNGEKTPNMLLASSIFGMLGGFFFGGSFGVALFFMCVGVLVSMFMLVARIVLSFVNAYLFIAIYMIIAPLFLPLMFLRVTTEYFDKWTKGIIAAIMMPTLIAAYVVLALSMYEALLFSDNASIKKLFDYPTVAKGMELPKQACDKQLTNDPNFRALATGQGESQLYDSPFLQNLLNPMLSGANNLCGGLKLPVFNITETDEKFKSEKQAFTQLFFDMFKVLVMGFLLTQGFSTVQSVIRLILGSGAAVATLDAAGTLETRLQTGIDGAKRSFQESLQFKDKKNENDSNENLTGAAFVERMLSGRPLREAIGSPSGSKGPGKGFLGGITRE